jgi:prepilin-type processing-associated H-X9-DG protein
VGLSDTNVAFAPNLYNISQPSRTPLFMESTNNSEFNTGGVNNAGGDWFLNVSPNFLATQNRWGGLRGKANVGFADGSVRSFTGQQLEQNGTAGAGTLARPNSVPPGQQWLGSTTGYHWRVFR